MCDVLGEIGLVGCSALIQHAEFKCLITCNSVSRTFYSQAYEDFDNTPRIGAPIKTWEPHAGDYVSGDPTWQGSKGTEIIGAINYLSGVGMNAFSFLTMNIDGDDKNVYPYLSTDPSDHVRMDVSKLAQWEIVFEHADKMGMFLHFKTQEKENSFLLDGGEFGGGAVGIGTERKLYYRELVARFGHHVSASRCGIAITSSPGLH